MIAFWLVAAIAALHLWIMVLEMFLWESAMARRAFGTSEVFAANTRAMAANQGLYNGFLAAGLVWALILGLPGEGWQEAVFFLSCVAVAGVFGGQTASRRILYIQGVPAALALLMVFLGV